MKLRPYQEEGAQAIIECLKTDRSTLLVMPPGCGKTQIFVAVAGRLGLRTLFLAHRDELITQAAHRIEQMLGTDPAIEKASEHASHDAQYVVASVQTLRWPRLGTWPRDHFGLVVVDESQHAVAKGHRGITSYFESAKVLGVTATPDRLDKLALGEVFDSVAYEYPLPTAVADGWLTRVTARRIRLKEIDLNGVSTRAGDFATNELEARIGHEKSLAAIRKAILEYSEGRKTLVYTPMVESACRLMQLLNEARPGCARVVHGETPQEERRETLRAHAAGEFQFVTSVGILTEGYDSPTVSCIAMARPTKSRALYAQILGRGMRLAEGKSDCLVLDFTGVTNQLGLVSPADALAGKVDDETSAALAEMPWGDEPTDMMKAIDEAKRRVIAEAERKRDLLAEHMRREAERKDRAQKARELFDQRLREQREQEQRRQAEKLEREERLRLERQEIVGSYRKYIAYGESLARKQVHPENLWELLDLPMEEWHELMQDVQPATPGQCRKLEERSKVTPIPELTFSAAAALISKLSERYYAGLATPRQLYFLIEKGVGDARTTFAEAQVALDKAFGKKYTLGEKYTRPRQETKPVAPIVWELFGDSAPEEKQAAEPLPPDLEDFLSDLSAAAPTTAPAATAEAQPAKDWIQELIDGSVSSEPAPEKPGC
jgi:superfamily II DNA or RNA helicase